MLPIGAAVPTAARVVDIDSGDEANCIEMQESTDESEDKVECNELGDKLAPKVKPAEQIFEQNLYWRISLKVSGKVQFSAVADGSTQDLHFQQSFQEAQLEPPNKHEETEQAPSAFQEKVPVKEEKPKTEPQKGKVHWLMAKKGKYIQSQQRTYLKCNVLQACFMKQQLLVSGKIKGKVTALDTLVEVTPNKCQWLVVENRSPDTVHVKRGMEIAEVSLLEDVCDVPEELVQQEKERHEQEAQQNAASAGEVIQVNGIEAETKPVPLTAEER